MRSDESSATRYALYYTPPKDHPLTRAASRWLGRDAFSACNDGLAGASADSHALTAEPRRYGFHATIKAPFRLRDGRIAEELEAAARGFCTARPICPIGTLRIARISNFFALVPSTTAPFLAGLASQAVADLDEFRAPTNEIELRRRLQSDLDETEATNLVTWGYPYVFDRFRFHMTLTGPVDADRQDSVREQLEAYFGPLLKEDFQIDALNLFVQKHREADFIVMARFPLRSPKSLMATG